MRIISTIRVLRFLVKRDLYDNRKPKYPTINYVPDEDIDKEINSWDNVTLLNKIIEATRAEEDF